MLIKSKFRRRENLFSKKNLSESSLKYFNQRLLFEAGIRRKSETFLTYLLLATTTLIPTALTDKSSPTLKLLHLTSTTLSTLFYL